MHKLSIEAHTTQSINYLIKSCFSEIYIQTGLETICFIANYWGSDFVPIFNNAIIKVLKNWSIEALQYWSIEVLKHWSIETLKYWNIEVLKHWSIETLKYWSIEVLKHWSIEALKYWSIEALKYWSIEVLKNDWKVIVLHLRTFNFMPLPLITIRLFNSNNISELIQMKSFSIWNTSIISPLSLRLWRRTMSYDKIRSIGMCFVAYILIFQVIFGFWLPALNCVFQVWHHKRFIEYFFITSGYLWLWFVWIRPNTIFDFLELSNDHSCWDDYF